MDDRDLRPRHHRSARIERIENALMLAYALIASALVYGPLIYGSVRFLTGSIE